MKYINSDKLLQEGKFKEFLDNQARQVRWLYNNSNKCSLVISEKDVRFIVYKLTERINELENEIRDIKK